MTARAKRASPLAGRHGRTGAAIGLALAVPLVAGHGTGWAKAPVLLERSTVLMGTELKAAVWAPSRQAAIEAIERAFAHVQRGDRLLSTWHPSEIGRLNEAAPGSPVRIPPELGRALREVQTWAAATRGAFDPAVGALVDAWDLRGTGRRPDAQELAGALGASGMSGFELLGDTAAIRKSDRSWIDTGGFGKGWALRGLRDTLSAHGVTSALVNFGGQVLAIGKPRDAERWSVGVASPTRRLCVEHTLEVAEGSVATSSQWERFIDADGVTLGHVLDPRSGMPVEPWGSVTVVSGDPMVADILSTALFVMGPEEGAVWLEGHPGFAVLWQVEHDGVIEARWTDALNTYVQPSQGEQTCFQ